MQRLNLNNSYNNEPVVYCKHCLSLKIRTVEDTDYCEKCGNVETEEASIYDWEKLYEVKYGYKLVNIKED